MIASNLRTVVVLILSVASGSRAPRVEGLSDWRAPEVLLEWFPAVARKAVAESRRNVLAKPADSELVGRFGMLLDAYGLYEAASACYERAHTLDARDFQWLYHFASICERLGSPEEAIRILGRARKLDRNYLPAQFKLAEALWKANRTVENLKAYQHLQRSHPEMPQAHYGAGRALAATGRTADALAAYARACELFPRYGPAHYAAAMLSRQLGDEPRAQRHFSAYQKDRDTVPPLPDPLRDRVRALNATGVDEIRAGVELGAAGRLDEAAAAHERALATNPDLEQARLNLIQLYARLGRSGKVEAHYRALAARNPNLAAAHYDYGVFLFERGRVHEAETAFGRALEINPNHAEALHNLGYLLENRGRLEQAERYYRQAIMQNPSYRLARFHLGRLLVNQRKYPEAIGQFQAILQPEDEKTPGYRYALAIAFGRAGMRVEALSHARIARQQAAAFGQSALVRSIDRDLQRLEGRP